MITAKPFGVDEILAATLSPTEKLVLIALCRQPPDATVKASALAAATGLHRVSVQKTLGALRGRGVLRQLAPQRWSIVSLSGNSLHAPDWRDTQDMFRKLDEFTPRSRRHRRAVASAK